MQIYNNHFARQSKKLSFDYFNKKIYFTVYLNKYRLVVLTCRVSY